MVGRLDKNEPDKAGRGVKIEESKGDNIMATQYPRTALSIRYALNESGYKKTQFSQSPREGYMAEVCQLIDLLEGGLTACLHGVTSDSGAPLAAVKVIHRSMQDILIEKYQALGFVVEVNQYNILTLALPQPDLM